MAFVHKQPQEDRPTARIVKRTEFAGAGAAVQAVGVLFCFLLFPVGLVVGITLLVIGGRMAIVHRCSECAEKVQKEAKVCAHCRARFVGDGE